MNTKKKRVTNAALSERMDEMDSLYTEMKTLFDELKETKETFHDGVLFKKVKETHDEMEEIFPEIREHYKDLFFDDDSTDSLKTKLDKLLAASKIEFAKIQSARNEVYGYTTQNEDGEEIKITGHLKEFKGDFESFKEEYTDLYDKIEKLLSGATTLGLAQDFNERATEYKWSRRIWEGCMVVLLCGVAGIYYFYGIPKPSLEIEELIIYLLRGLPFFLIFVWLAGFVGNRRAENKKLEESYKHKESMAKTFEGYKRSIKELSSDEDSDKLQTVLMRNLINAIKIDSGKFLTSKGEGHPLTEAINSRRSKNSGPASKPEQNDA